MKKTWSNPVIDALELNATAFGGVDTNPGETCPLCGKTWTGVSGKSAHKGWCPNGTGAGEPEGDLS